jgi:septal ring factor EnvC (AmiA/AmiB activator)
MSSETNEDVHFNPKTLYTLLCIVALMLGLVGWAFALRSDLDLAQKDITSLEEKHKELASQDKALQDKLTEISTKLEVIRVQQGQIQKDLAEVKSDVKVLTDGR